MMVIQHEREVPTSLVEQQNVITDLSLNVINNIDSINRLSSGMESATDILEYIKKEDSISLDVIDHSLRSVKELTKVNYDLYIGSGVEGVVDSIGKFIKSIFDGIIDAITMLFDGIASLITKFLKFIKELFGGKDNEDKKPSDKIEDIKTKVEEAVSNVHTGDQELSRALYNNVGRRNANELEKAKRLVRKLPLLCITKGCVDEKVLSIRSLLTMLTTVDIGMSNLLSMYDNKYGKFMSMFDSTNTFFRANDKDTVSLMSLFEKVVYIAEMKTEASKNLEMIGLSQNVDNTTRLAKELVHSFKVGSKNYLKHGFESLSFTKEASKSLEELYGDRIFVVMGVTPENIYVMSTEKQENLDDLEEAVKKLEAADKSYDKYVDVVALSSDVIKLMFDKLSLKMKIHHIQDIIPDHIDSIISDITVKSPDTFTTNEEFISINVDSKLLEDELSKLHSKILKLVSNFEKESAENEAYMEDIKKGLLDYKVRLLKLSSTDDINNITSSINKLVSGVTTYGSLVSKNASVITSSLINSATILKKDEIYSLYEIILNITVASTISEDV